MKLQVYSMMALLCAAIAACKKERVDSTPTGKNTFSCLIDGKHFTPQGSSNILSTVKPVRASRSNRVGGFFIQARNSFHELDIYFAATQGVGTYTLGYTRNPFPYSSTTGNYGAYQYNRPLLPGDDPYNIPTPVRYYTDATNTGTVTVIRFDTLARVPGGSFEYTVLDKATGQLVRITKGQFDVSF